MIPAKLSRPKKQISLISIPQLASDQRGITGLETAIVLIAFVVVSSVFAYAALSAGLFSSDKANETHTAGLAEARGTLELKGSVVAKVSGTTGATGVVTSIEFLISNAAAGEAIDMTPGNSIIKYSDKTQTVNMNSSAEFSSSNVAAFGDTDLLLEFGEVFQITLLDLTTQLATDLGTNTDFTIEMIPSRGAVLFIGRRTPVSLEASNRLD
jgi:flagellin FlaB